MKKIQTFYAVSALAVIAIIVSFVDPSLVPKDSRISLLLVLAWMDSAIKLEKLSEKVQVQAEPNAKYWKYSAYVFVAAFAVIFFFGA